MRLRSALVLAIVSLLLATVLLVGGSAYSSATHSANKLTEDVLAQATDRIDRVVRAQLDVATSASELMQRPFARGELHPDDLDTIARYELDILTSHPALTYVTFSRDVNGEMAQAFRNDAGELRIRFLKLRGESLDMIDYAPEADGARSLVRTEQNKNANDGRKRPYYLAAREAGKPVWLETYPFFGDSGKLGAPGVTLATPVFDRSGAFLGVATADFDLRDTSRFLNDIGLFAHGEAFVVEYRKDGKRAVIAHPKPEILAKQSPGEANGLVAASVEDIDDPTVVEFAKSLPLELPNPGSKMQLVRFRVSGSAYVGGFRALGGGQVRWVVCALAPEDDVLGEVHRNQRISFAIIVGATVIAVLLALWMGAKIARPLRVVADETEEIGQFRLELRAPPKSAVLEVSRLAKAVEQMKRNLRSFKKYVPAEVVRELVANGKEAALGGRREQLTIHFSDIADFTSIAEATDPEKLVSMLGEYLSEMTQPILDSGGTLDKFIGDAVMAFWGAPRPDAKHALHACDAALKNRDRLAELNRIWEKQGRPRFDARAAIHTGEVIVGNIGSADRFDYTVIGDSVNLASRMEGLNKKYGTSLMISEVTYEIVKDEMIARPLDRVSVKGKANAINVYELLGRRSDVPEEAKKRAERHAEGFSHYLARRFDQARAIFVELVEADEKDVAARVLLERCEGFLASPPPENWDGSEHMKTK